MAAPHVPIETFRIQYEDGGGITIPRLTLRDRRAAGHRQLHWVYQRQLENVLYKRAGDGGTSGAIWKILNGAGLGSTALAINGAAVASGQVTQQEYDEIVARFKLSTDGIDPCSKGRIRSCTLLPIATAAAVCRTFGRSHESVAFLRLFNQAVPEAWELQEQAEEDDDNGEVDLLLQEQLESGASLEMEEVESFAEELQQMAPFAADADEEGRMKTYALPNPSAELTAQLKQYVASRTAIFDPHRSGSAVVGITVEGDVQNVLRFFGYLERTHRVPEGASLYSLAFMVRADLGTLVRDYAYWLRENQRLRYGSVANYLNGLASVTKWAYSALPIPDATAVLEPSPLAQIYNLRGQAEGQSKTENMFEKRIGGWISWADVQKARLEAVKRSSEKPRDTKLLRDAATISLLSLIPPDRVGLIRKLRLGHTLKRAEGGGWRLDLSKQRDGHKTSKFYGPFAAKLPDELTPILDAYAGALQLTGQDFDQAYIFYPPTATKPDRAMESSAWTQYVRKLFGKFTGTEIAPKTLRSIFITWLKESTDCPEVLKSAAHAMKHQVATQASAHYDANADTKLVKAAYDFNLKYASQFGGGGGASSAGGTGGDDDVQVAHAFERITPQPDEYTFHLAPGDKQPAADASYRVFICDIPWLPTFSPGCTVRFAVVPGQADGVTRTLPERDDIVGKKLRISVDVEKQAVRASSFAVANLLLLVEPDAAEATEEEEAEEEEAAAEEEGALSIAGTESVSDKGNDSEDGEDGDGADGLPGEMDVDAAPPAAAEDAAVAEPPKKKQRAKNNMVPEQEEVSTVTELTLDEALLPFAGMSVVEEAPEWLEAALEAGSSKELIGRHIAYNWEEYGYACGKLGSTAARDSNFSVTYEGSWKENQTLAFSSYGRGDFGSWLLLEGEVNSAPPLVGYVKGKYLVRHADGDTWVRGADLIFHTNAQMEAARTSSQVSKQAAIAAAVEQELQAPHAVGDEVFVKAVVATGEQYFRAEVVAIRARFPPIRVKYISTLTGETGAIKLPAPITAFVPAERVTTTPPAAPPEGGLSRRSRA